LILTLGYKPGSRGGVLATGSNFGMDDTASGTVADKKFEGFSNLKGKSERLEKKQNRALNAKVSDDLD